MPLGGRQAALKITASSPTATTNEAATRSTGVTGTGYVQINSTTKRHWDPTAVHTLWLNSTLVSSTNYNINYIQGKFEWRTGDPPTGTYTIDANYLAVSSVAGGREWTANVEVDLFDTTEFGSSGWKQFQPNLVGATAQIQKFWTDAAFYDRINLQTRFVAELIINSVTGEKYEGFAFLSGDQINTPVDGLVSETVDLNIDGQLYYTT